MAGRTRFTIRSGFRFSPPSNQTVTAQTFKDTIERALNPRMKAPLAYEFTDIVGARAYMAGSGAAHLGDRRGRRHTDDPSACAGGRLSFADRATGVLRGPIQYTDRSRRGAEGSLRGPVLRRVIHPRARGRAGAQPKLSRQPPATLCTNRSGGGSFKRSGRRRRRSGHRRLHNPDHVPQPDAPRVPARRSLRARQRRSGARTAALLPRCLAGARLPRTEHAQAAVQRRASAPGGQLRHRPPRARRPRRRISTHCPSR